MRAFRERKIWILVCTELMSRGIDFKGVNLVINYDFPPTTVSYIHRVGRTGRAGRPGRAITFWTMQDKPYLRRLDKKFQCGNLGFIIWFSFVCILFTWLGISWWTNHITAQHWWSTSQARRYPSGCWSWRSPLKNRRKCWLPNSRIVVTSPRPSSTKNWRGRRKGWEIFCLSF